MIKLICNNCNNEYEVINSRKNKSKFCSRKCSDLSKKAKPNQKCDYCGDSFHLKESAVKRYNRKMGIFCSMKCSSNYKKEYFLGKNNPNYRGRQYDSDGYRINHYPKKGRMREHKYIVTKYLSIDEIPKNHCIHHRDCNIYNNKPENLVILSNSDHRWLHKQYGNATLWAFMNNKITLEELILWSNDPKKAKKLLPLNIKKQKNEY
jgi:hypothetical protein